MKKIVKSYNEEGVKYQFDSKKMLMYANQMKSDLQMHGKKTNKSNIMKELAEKLYISEDAVKSWMYGNNGPSDLEQVKLVADYFGVDYHQLLDKEEKEMATNNTVSIASGMANEMQQQYTKDRVRELYTAILDSVDALMDYYYAEIAYTRQEKEESEDVNESIGETYFHANAMIRKVDSILERNMLDIPEVLYKNVHEYLWTEIDSLFQEAIETFNHDEEQDESLTEEEMEHLDERIKHFRNGGYMSDLRRIFADFIVK